MALPRSSLAQDCGSVTDILYVAADGTLMPIDGTQPDFVGRYHPIGGLTFPQIQLTAVASTASPGATMTGTLGVDLVNTCSVDWKVVDTTVAQMAVGPTNFGYETLTLWCQTQTDVGLVQPISIDVLDSSGSSLYSTAINVRCLSYCTLQNIWQVSPVVDMLMLKGTTETFTFGQIMGMDLATSPDCAIEVGAITCVSAGCSHPGPAAFASSPNVSFTWTEASQGTFDFSFVISYAEYNAPPVPIDATGSATVSFTLTVLNQQNACDLFTIIRNNPTGSLKQVWIFEPNTVQVQYPTDGTAAAGYTCVYKYAHDAVNPTVALAEGASELQVAIVPDSLSEPSFTVRTYFDGYQMTSSVALTVLHFDVISCMDFEIQVDTSLFGAIDNPEVIRAINNEPASTLDLSGNFANIGTGDYADGAGHCSLTYQLQGTSLPAWVTLADPTQPVVTLEPVGLEFFVDLAIPFDFAVVAIYAGYETVAADHQVEYHVDVQPVSFCGFHDITTTDPNPFTVDVWAYQTTQFSLEQPTSTILSLYPTDCEVSGFFNVDSKSYISIIDPVWPATISTVEHTHPGTLPAEKYSLKAYYDNYIGYYESNALVLQIDVTVLYCTDNPIQVTQDTTVYQFYNHETNTIDFSPVFTNVGSGDHSTSGYCPLQYELEPVANAPDHDAPPSYVTIPDNSVPTIQVAPATTDFTGSQLKFRVKCSYAGDYATDYPEYTVTADFTIDITSICQEVPLVWDSSFMTSYTVPVGQTLMVQYTQPTGQHTTWPTICQIQFATSGDIWTAPTPDIMLQENSNTGSFEFEFEIGPIQMTHVATWSYTVDMRYSILPATGYESYADQITFTIEIVPPDNCNTLYPPIAPEFGSVQPVTWTVDLCTTETLHAAEYTPAAPIWCGALDYLFTPDPSTVYLHSVTSGVEQVITVYEDDPAFLTGGPYQVTVRPDYQNDPDETLIYHDGDTVDITFRSPCQEYAITMASTPPSVYEVYVLDTHEEILPTISTVGELYCPLDCVQQQLLSQVAVTNFDASLSFDIASHKLTITSTNENQLGEKTGTIYVDYQTHPEFTAEALTYTFTVNINSICLRPDAGFPLYRTDPSVTQIEIEEMLRVTKTQAFTDFWTSTGVMYTPLDCELGFRLVDTFDFLTVDSATQSLTLAATDWSEFGMHYTTLEVYFVNYDPSVTRDSIPLQIEVLANCEEPTTWIKKPSSITNHVDTWSSYGLETSSLALTWAPDDCKLTFSVSSATVSSSPASASQLALFEVIDNSVGATGELVLDDCLSSTLEGTFRIKIEGFYPGFESFDPFAAQYDPLGTGTVLQSEVEVTIAPKCHGADKGIRSYTTSVEPVSKIQYIQGTGLMQLPFTFDIDTYDAACEIQQLYKIFIDNEDKEVDIIKFDVFTVPPELQIDESWAVDFNDHLETVYSVKIYATARTVADTPAPVDIEFKIVVLATYDPCIYGIFERTPDYELPDMSFMIKDATHGTEPLLPYSFNTTGCNPISYYYPVGLPYNPLFVYLDQTDPSNRYFDVWTDQYADIGTFEVTLTLSLDSYAYEILIRAELTFDLVITHVCSKAVVTWSSGTPPSFVYKLGSGIELVEDVTGLFLARDPDDASASGLLDTTKCGNYQITLTSLDKTIGNPLVATSFISSDIIIECCNTENQNDYGAYQIQFDVVFVEHQTMVPVPLYVDLEIVPDCEVYEVFQANGEPVFYEIFAKVDQFGLLGDTQKGFVDFSASFSHTFDGHAADFCGQLVVELTAQTQTDFPYLSIDPGTLILTSAPTQISEIMAHGALAQIQVYLPNWQVYETAFYDIDTTVLPYCGVDTYTPQEETTTESYLIGIDPELPIDMSFNFSWEAASTDPTCENEKVQYFFFKFDGYGVNERPPFFVEETKTQSSVQSIDPSHENEYVITVWEILELPSLETVRNDVNRTISLTLEYDPCKASIIEDQVWDQSWVYNILAVEEGTNQEYTKYDLPFFENNVTKTGHPCGAMVYQYSDLPAFSSDGIEMQNQKVEEVIYRTDFLTMNHALHREERSFKLTIYMQDYPSIYLGPLEIKIKFYSECADTYFSLQNDDDSFIDWYVTGSKFYFYYQVGNPPKMFQAQIQDNVSSKHSLEGENFCGARQYELSDVSEPTMLQLIGADTTGVMTGYYPSLQLHTEDLASDSDEDLDIWGVFGNQILLNDTTLLVQPLTATLQVTSSYFVNVTQSFEITCYIINSCQRVFMYKEQQIQSMKVAVLGPEKSSHIGKFRSYLDVVMQEIYGFAGLETSPICGRPELELRCLLNTEENELRTTILEQLDQFDIETFTPEFIEGITAPANFMLENPGFMTVSYQGDGTTIVTAKSDEDIWDSEPYVCLMDAFIEQEWPIARPYDFIEIQVLGADFRNANNVPVIQGIDGEFTVQYPDSLEGSFSLVDNDDFDIGQLALLVSLSGTEITTDCECVEFQASYATSDGASGKDTIENALELNQLLTEIAVDFTFEPTQDMVGKTYELTLTLTDLFSSTSTILAFKVEGEPVEEVEYFEFEGVIVSDETDQEEKSTISELISIKNFFKGGPLLTPTQYEELLKKMTTDSYYPLPVIYDISEDGLVNIQFSKEVLAPSPDTELEAKAQFIRSITYQHAFELLLESDELIIRGEPLIANKYAFNQKEAPSTEPIDASGTQSSAVRRDLQDDQFNNDFSYFPYFTDTWNTTAPRFTGYSEGDDDLEKSQIQSRYFNWTIQDYTAKGMKLKMNFARPGLISSYKSDSVKLHVLQPHIFLVTEYIDYYATDFWNSDFAESRFMPKQQSLAQESAAESASTAGSVGLQVLTIVNLVVAGFMQMSLDELWIVINSLSFIVYVPLIFAYEFPSTCVAVLESLLSVVTFDVIETLDTFGIDVMPFDFTETPPYNFQFESLGLENSNTISLLGSVNFLVLYMVTIFVLSSCSKVCFCCRNRRFCKRIKTKFPFKGQLDTLNRLVITGSLELLFCTWVNVATSQTGDPSLLDIGWYNLPLLDRFALAFGLCCLGIVVFMIVSYVGVIVYMAPKVAHIAQNQEKEQLFATRISAYQAAIRDMRKKAAEKAKLKAEEELAKQGGFLDSEIAKGFNIDLALPSQADDSFQQPRLSSVVVMDTSQALMLPSDQSLATHQSATFNSMSHARNPKQALLASQQQQADVKTPEQMNIDRQAMVAAGMGFNIDENSFMQFSGAELEGVDEEVAKLDKSGGTENSEGEEQEYDAEKVIKNATFKFQYEKAMTMTEEWLIERIRSLVKARRINKVRGKTNKKLTKTQETILFYFGDLFEGISQRNTANYYYLLIYLFRRVAFVYTAFYMTGYPNYQLAITYFLCLAMLCILVSSKPYKSVTQNTLESINEFIVLVLLLQTYFMFFCIETVADEDERIQLYERIGLIFTITLTACIAINFIRIIGNMCAGAIKGYIKKLRIHAIKAAQFDRGSSKRMKGRICDCTCYTCSVPGFEKTEKHDTANWGPIQPLYFKLNVTECPDDETRSFQLLLQQEQPQPLENTLTGGKQSKIGPDPSNPLEGLEDSLGLGVRKRRVKFAPNIQANSAIQGQPKGPSRKIVRFSLPDDSDFYDNMVGGPPLTFAEQAAKTRKQELRDLIRASPYDPNEDDEGEAVHQGRHAGIEGADWNTQTEASTYMQEMFAKDTRSRDDTHQENGLLFTNTRQVRYRNWIRKNVFAAEMNFEFRSKHFSKQRRLRETLVNEADLLEQVQDGDELRKAAEKLQYGISLVTEMDKINTKTYLLNQKQIKV